MGRDYFNKSNKLWFELWNQRNIKKFAKKRIVTPEISSKNSFTIIEDFFGNTKTYHIILRRDGDTLIDEYYLLALLNSKLLDFIYKKIATPYAGGFYAYKTQFLSKISIKEISESQQKPFINIVDRILAITKDEDYLQNSQKQAKVKSLEREIDQMVYQLYDLTKAEIAIVEEA